MPTGTETIEAARAAGEGCMRCGLPIRWDQTRSRNAPVPDTLLGGFAHRRCFTDHGGASLPSTPMAAVARRPTLDCPACGGLANRFGKPEGSAGGRRWECRSQECLADGTWKVGDGGEILARVRRPRAS